MEFTDAGPLGEDLGVSGLEGVQRRVRFLTTLVDAANSPEGHA
ncbi:hypothetical protein AB0G35_31255 [Streptomyces sp. NPDC021749]